VSISQNAIVVDCKIGDGTSVWHFANLYGCQIGSNCTVGSYVEITRGVVIGNNVTISSHSFICELVTIEDNVFVGHGVMTINDIKPPSYKKTGSKADWQRTLIGRGVVIGSNATLFPVSIGEYAVVGAGAVVTKNVPPGATVVGNPARIIGANS